MLDLSKGENIIGIVQGKTKTMEYTFRVLDLKRVMQGQYVIAKDRETGKEFLGQIIDIISSGLTSTAYCTVLGEIKNNKLTAPSRPVKAGSEVIMPPRELLENLLVKALPERRLLVGKLLTHPEFVPVYYNPDDFAKHIYISASTGGGKSYTIGVFIEEIIRLMEQYQEEFSIIIFDVHNEYGGILLPNDDPKQIEKLKEYNLSPRSFSDNVIIFDWEYNPPKLSPYFTPDRLLFIYGMKEQRHALILQQLVKEKGSVHLEELLNMVEYAELHPSTRQALHIRIKALLESGLFSEDYLVPEEVFQPSRVIIFRLAEIPLGDFGLRFFVADVLRQIFDRYKQRKFTHKTLVVVDEAHIFAPRKGKKDPIREIIERIAREGRKYGLWLILASQSPRDLSEVVLMQCNSVLALKMNKEDITEFSKIFGIPKTIGELLTTFPPGHGYLKAPSLILPVLVEIRAKMSFDTKGNPERQKLVDNAVKKIALESSELIYGARKREREFIEEKKILSEEADKPVVKEPEPIEKEIKKQIPPPPVLETQKQTQKLERPLRKGKRSVPIQKEAIVYDQAVIQSVIQEIREQGLAARELMRRLILLKEIPIAEALTLADERIIDMLKVIGFVSETYRTLRLNLINLLEKRIGRKLNRSEIEKYLDEIYRNI